MIGGKEGVVGFVEESRDLDPSEWLKMHRQKKKKDALLINLLNRKSGLLRHVGSHSVQGVTALPPFP